MDYVLRVPLSRLFDQYELIIYLPLLEMQQCNRLYLQHH